MLFGRGNFQPLPEGKCTLSIIDTSSMPPASVVTVEDVGNNLFGPPTNLVITPDERMTLVAEALAVVEQDGKPAIKKSNLVHVIDLTSEPPSKIASVEVGLQPSGMALSPDGSVALVCNRAGNSISVLQIEGTDVRNVGTVDIGETVTHVAFTRDGARALATKFDKFAVSLLEVRGTEVTYTGIDIPVGPYPYNLSITPDGSLALVPNMGGKGRSDGNMDSVTVIDLTAEPPRVIGHVTVGDAPEGIAMSPDGALAVTTELNGVDAPPDAWFHSELTSATILRIDGKEVSVVGKLRTGRDGVGTAFSPDGKYLLIANLLDDNVMAFPVEEGQVKEPPIVFSVGKGPAAMRSVIPYAKPYE